MMTFLRGIMLARQLLTSVRLEEVEGFEYFILEVIFIAILLEFAEIRQNLKWLYF